MAEEKIIDIDSLQLKKYLKERPEETFWLIDVREPKEYKVSHIPGAILLPLKEVESQIVMLDPSKEIIFYCRSGRRSKIAAYFASELDLGFPRIFNLKGGILSWQGKTLTDFPKIEAFDLNLSIQELLVRSIDLEKGAENFYNYCINIFDDKDIKKSISTLARLEIAHAKTVYNILKEEGSDIPSFEELYSRAKGDIIEGGIAINDAIGRVLAKGDSLINFVEFALDIEFMAYELYKNLMFKASTVKTALVFSKLAEQEKGHIRVVSSILNKTWE